MNTNTNNLKDEFLKALKEWPHATESFRWQVEWILMVANDKKNKGKLGNQILVDQIIQNCKEILENFWQNPAH